MIAELLTMGEIIATCSSKEIGSFSSNHCRQLKSKKINVRWSLIEQGQRKCKWFEFGGWAWNPSYVSKTHVDFVEKNSGGKFW
ncbi:unnamed protein product [Linum trigynum]|uniref:Uncharacterized protein n=1 Tax=Linum trigynum TaxID=586398 RepID=A0AAV2CMZ5_9ROSI